MELNKYLVALEVGLSQIPTRDLKRLEKKLKEERPVLLNGNITAADDNYG